MSFKQYIGKMLVLTLCLVVGITMVMTMGVTSASSGGKEAFNSVDPLNCIIATGLAIVAGLVIVYVRHHKEKA